MEWCARTAPLSYLDGDAVIAGPNDFVWRLMQVVERARELTTCADDNPATGPCPWHVEDLRQALEALSDF